MGDSEDDFDARSRDKFRRERNDIGQRPQPQRNDGNWQKLVIAIYWVPINQTEYINCPFEKFDYNADHPVFRTPFCAQL